MNGYTTHAGFWGYVPDRGGYILFATEQDYYDFMT